MPAETKYELKPGAATREAFGRTLVELGRENKDIVVCDADLSKSTMTVYFQKEFPDRFFSFGIAEANMVAAGCGMAYAGKIPQTNSIGNLPPKDQYNWGVELGRRMRDSIRAERASGTKIDTWQFDDVGVIDEPPVLRRGGLHPSCVTHPMGEEMDVPALTLESDVVLERYAHRLGGRAVVVHRVDRLLRRRIGISEGPRRVRLICVQRNRVRAEPRDRSAAS